MIVRFIRAFCQAFLRELNRLSCNRFDLAMAMIAPLVIIVLFGAMFYHGKAHVLSEPLSFELTVTLILTSLIPIGYSFCCNL